MYNNTTTVLLGCLSYHFQIISGNMSLIHATHPNVPHQINKGTVDWVTTRTINQIKGSHHEGIQFHKWPSDGHFVSQHPFGIAADTPQRYITYINVMAYQYYSNFRGKSVTFCTTLTSYECHGVSNYRQLGCLLNNLLTESLVAYYQLGRQEQIEEQFHEIATILCRQNAFENIVCKMATPVITIMWDNSYHMVYSWALMFSWTRLITSTLRRGQDGRRFPDDIFKCIFLNENDKIPFQISMKFVPRSPIDNKPVPIHYLIQCWLVIKSVQGNSHESNFTCALARNA